MKCPYCNFELTFCDQTVADKQVAVCRNPECKYTGWHLPVEIFDELNAGKCAAHNLSVVREQFDRGYNTWVRSDNDLRQKLKQAQDALKIVEDKLQQIHLGVETSIDPRSHAMTLVVIQSIASDALKIITSTTEQDTQE